MQMDKDQKPVVKLAIEQTYGHVLRRALAITVFRGLERNPIVDETKQQTPNYQRTKARHLQ